MSWLDIAGLGMDLFNGLLGHDAQKSANEANLQIARENNAWSEKMMQKQMDYNTEMWNKQNEYNDPSAQMARLQAAGLSPYRMMSAGNTGTAGSAQGVGLPSPQQTRLEAEKFEFGAASQRLLQMSEHEHQEKLADADTRLKLEQLRGMKIDNLHKEKLITAQLAEIASRTKSFDAKTALDNAIHDFERDAKSLKLKQLESGVNYSDAQTALLEVQKLIADNELYYMDERHQLQMANLMQDTAKKLSETYLTYKHGEALDEQIKQIKESTKKIIADTQGQKNANKLFDVTWEFAVREAELRSVGNPWQEIEMQRRENYHDLYGTDVYDRYRRRDDNGNRGATSYW